MNDRLKGKRALVTAAGQGIGRATALAFRRQGAEVIATDIAEAGLASLEAAGCSVARLDATDGAAIAALVRSAGSIDVLFNAAGIVLPGDVLSCSEQDWDRSFEINVKSQFLLIRAVLPGMLERRSGSIINVSSVVGGVKAAVNRCAYAASKAAIIGLTKAVAADYVSRGVRCNAICPGTIASPSLDERIQAQSIATGQSEADVRATFVARQPIGRLGSTEEIAALSVYLASDESAFTTGTIQIIDGGWSA